MEPKVTPGQFEATVSCPCCGKEFIGYGIDEADAKQNAIGKLQDHMEMGDC